ncbi:hypothetical protein JZ751_003467 [Albula glossodonta]|uniref:GIY-YIG domain-containing protein n=1 Tax=Albula glossodonta TaxID=121402 RepID=A0A8T2MUF0_9TELE|nr:hypothetical protein JZ751_003467 [Albula glossodonta]
MAEAGPLQKVDAVAVAVLSSDTPPGIYQCTAQRCNCCQFMVKGVDQFHGTNTKKFYKIKQVLTCKTSSVIYIIECKKCKIQYVGKTKSFLKTRFSGHKNSIIKQEIRPIPDHFNNDGHSLEDLVIFPIEQVTDSGDLNDRELYWISELETMEKGLNLVPFKCAKRQGRIEPPDQEPPEEANETLAEESVRSDMGASDQRVFFTSGSGEGKRKRCEDGKPKRRKKLKKKKLSVFTYETEQRLLTCEDAQEDGEKAISQVYNKLSEVSCRTMESKNFLEDLKNKVLALSKPKPKKIYIGLFGKTGEGKSSLINAIVNEDYLLPSVSGKACTSVFVQVQANTENKKYKADIEFISKEDWESELHFLLEILSDEQDLGTDTEDKVLKKMAEEKITAIYGEDGKKKTFRELMAIQHSIKIPDNCKKTLSLDTADELSKSIGTYIRSDKKNKQQFWPLVKQVTIYLPNSPALLEGIVLVDLPGAGDVNKHRAEMWKECLSLCSSVWIVSNINRVLSEDVPNEIFDKTLRTIAGGGECHNITFVCTKTDDIDPREISDEELGIADMEDSSDGENRENKEKQACIIYRNKKAKEEIIKCHGEKAVKLLLGDKNDTSGFFDVFTVSSREFKKITQKKPSILEENETEVPSLREHIKELYVSHTVRKVADYECEVSGIISYLHFSKEASRAKISHQDFYHLEFHRLAKALENTCTKLDKFLTDTCEKFHNILAKGVKEAEQCWEKNATEKVLESTQKDNRGHHKKLKALCKCDGYYRSSSGEIVDLNYTLSEPMYKKMNVHFLQTFGSESSRTSIKGNFSSFQEDFITSEQLRGYKKELEKYLRLVYIRTQQRKLLKDLEKEMLQRKKQIYNSLSDSIRDTMRPTYEDCSRISGTSSFTEIQRRLKSKIESSKKVMFNQAMREMLKQFGDLKEYLVKEIKTQMTTVLSVALNQIPDDLTGLPDVSEEMEMMQRCCEALKLRVFK